jgi:hypothetical protein
MKSFDITKTKVPEPKDYPDGPSINNQYIYGFQAGVKACRKAIRERLKKLEIRNIEDLQSLYVKSSPALQLLRNISEQKEKEFLCDRCKCWKKIKARYTFMQGSSLCFLCFKKGWWMRSDGDKIFFYRVKV